MQAFPSNPSVSEDHPLWFLVERLGDAVAKCRTRDLCRQVFWRWYAQATSRRSDGDSEGLSQQQRRASYVYGRQNSNIHVSRDHSEDEDSDTEVVFARDRGGSLTDQQGPVSRPLHSLPTPRERGGADGGTTDNERVYLRENSLVLKCILREWRGLAAPVMVLRRRLVTCAERRSHRLLYQCFHGWREVADERERQVWLERMVRVVTERSCKSRVMIAWFRLCRQESGVNGWSQDSEKGEQGWTPGRRAAPTIRIGTRSGTSTGYFSSPDKRLVRPTTASAGWSSGVSSSPSRRPAVPSESPAAAGTLANQLIRMRHKLKNEEDERQKVLSLLARYREDTTRRFHEQRVRLQRVANLYAKTQYQSRIQKIMGRVFSEWKLHCVKVRLGYQPYARQPLGPGSTHAGAFGMRDVSQTYAYQPLDQIQHRQQGLSRPGGHPVTTVLTTTKAQPTCSDKFDVEAWLARRGNSTAGREERDGEKQGAVNRSDLTAKTRKKKKISKRPRPSVFSAGAKSSGKTWSKSKSHPPGYSAVQQPRGSVVLQSEGRDDDGDESTLARMLEGTERISLGGTVASHSFLTGRSGILQYLTLPGPHNPAEEVDRRKLTGRSQ